MDVNIHRKFDIIYKRVKKPEKNKQILKDICPKCKILYLVDKTKGIKVCTECGLCTPNKPKKKMNLAHFVNYRTV